MGFFDELGKKLSDASQDVMQKGKEMADTARFNSQIEGKAAVEAVAEEAKEAVSEAGEAAANAAEGAADAAKQAADHVENAAEQAVNKAEDAVDNAVNGN